MKRFIFIMVMLVTFSSQAQGGFFELNQDEETFISGWVDPTFTDGGFQIGLEITKELEGGWVTFSLSHYEDLNPSYTDIVGSGGVNFHLFNTDAIKYYVGGRLGVEFREGNPHALIGFVGGADIKIDREGILRGGIRGWRDFRASQHEEFYGGKDDDQWVNNFALVLTVRIND